MTWSAPFFKIRRSNPYMTRESVEKQRRIGSAHMRQFVGNAKGLAPLPTSFPVRWGG